MENILHLSDIHFGRNYPEYGEKDTFEDKDKILDELIKCIASIETDKRPKHIVVTGDVAWRGKEKEFDEAYQWFNRLLKATGLNGKDITFCVGNHDLNWNYVCANRDLKDRDIERIDRIYDYDCVHEMEMPIHEYERFCEKIGMEPFKYPLNGKMEYSYSVGYKDVLLSGNEVRFLAFNTALLSCLPGIKADKMWIGQAQVKSLLKYGVLSKENGPYSIALFHHAERFLAPEEICEYDGRIATLPMLRNYVNLILCGHTETGGRPVLQEQCGGGKLLTGGAAYFSDVHPNGFSMIYIDSNKKTMDFDPYTFDGKWKKYDYESNEFEIEKIEELPELGEIKEHCKFIVNGINDPEKKYEILMKRVSLFKDEKNGQILRFNNRKEVTREFDIECVIKVDNMIDVQVKDALRIKRKCSKRLESEKFFYFLSKLFQSEDLAKITVVSETGNVILSGNMRKRKIEPDKFGIEFLEKVIKIEKFYGVKFYLPDDVYVDDVEKVDILLKLIDNGYITEEDYEKIRIKNVLPYPFSNKETAEELNEQASRLNKFCFVHEGQFFCELFGANFSLGTMEVIAGAYQIDREDLIHKIETFRDGDLRACILKENEKVRTYLAKEEALEKVKERIGSEFSSIAKKEKREEQMKIKFGWIYEK